MLVSIENKRKSTPLCCQKIILILLLNRIYRFSNNRNVGSNRIRPQCTFEKTDECDSSTLSILRTRSNAIRPYVMYGNYGCLVGSIGISNLSFVLIE